MCVLGTLAAMEKLVHLGRLHMRPIQWYFKDHWNHSKILDTNHHRFTSSTQVVAVQRQLGQAMFPPSQNTPGGSLLRRLLTRMGSPLRSADSTGPVGSDVVRQTHQCTRTTSCTSRTTAVPTLATRTHSVSPNGQFHCSSVPSQTG